MDGGQSDTLSGREGRGRVAKERGSDKRVGEREREVREREREVRERERLISYGWSQGGRGTKRTLCDSHVNAVITAPH